MPACYPKTDCYFRKSDAKYATIQGISIIEARSLPQPTALLIGDVINFSYKLFTRTKLIPLLEVLHLAIAL